MASEPLCPDPSLWRLSLITLHRDRVALHLRPVRNAVTCPACGTTSSRVHSRYRRRPRDLPWSSWPVQLVIHTRKFFCHHDQCSRRIFTEPFPGVLARYSRQTERLRRALLELAHASNGESAARVSRLLGYVTSPDSLISLQWQEQFPVPTPQALGVDEFALRRGCTYGTILVDLENHQPVDILEGKQAEPLTQWLREHQGVEILARDRAEAYALAGRTAAPNALQVADRFHLVHNVGDALKELFRSRRWEIPPASTAATPVKPAVTIEATPPVKEPRPTPRKQALWEAVQLQKDTGQSNSAIARELGVNRKTIGKYLAAERPPACAPRVGRRTKLAPYIPYLRQRWAEGCHNSSKLYADLVAHCGHRAEGAFLHTLVLTDVATGWTECLPLLFRTQEAVVQALGRARQLLPMGLLGLDTDNGSEFLNAELIGYCARERITFTRGRAYKKNDQCFVEQKNGSIVRHLVGYNRFEGEAAYRVE